MTFASPDRSLQWEVIEEHLSEGAFRWRQWEWDLIAHDYLLSDVAAGDERRLWHHVQALAMAGPEAMARVLVPALEDDEDERTVVAALSMLTGGQEEGAHLVLDALAASEGTRLAALQRGLQLSSRADLHDAVSALVDSDRLELVASALEILAFWRSGRHARAEELWRSDDAMVRAAVLRHLGQHPDSVAPAIVSRSLVDSDAAVRAAALELGLVMGLSVAWTSCRELVESPDEDGSMARLALGLGGEEADHERLISLTQVEHLRRDALWALGYCGTIEAAEACLPWLGDAKAGPVAAESFAAITGLPLEDPFIGSGTAVEPDAQVAAPPPEGFENGTKTARLAPAVDPDARIVAPPPEEFDNGTKTARLAPAAEPDAHGGAPRVEGFDHGTKTARLPPSMDRDAQDAAPPVEGFDHGTKTVRLPPAMDRNARDAAPPVEGFDHGTKTLRLVPAMDPDAEAAASTVEAADPGTRQTQQPFSDVEPDDGEDEDDSPVLDADFGLPGPVPEEIARWWSELRPRLTPNQRYLGGAQLDPRLLPRALHAAAMRRRPGLALELAIRTGGARRVQTRAPTWVQLKQANEAQNEAFTMSSEPLSRLLRR